MVEPSAPLVRTQLLITPALRQRLERMAQQEGRSLSEVARRALEAGLDELEGEDERARRRLEALEALAELRAEIEARYGVYQGDIIAEVRAERERQLDRVWRGE